MTGIERMRDTRPVVALAMLCSALVVAGLVASGATDTAALTTVLATVAAASLSAAVAVRLASRATVPRALHLGHRAGQHRESLGEQAEPAHPDTTGSVRERAPGRSA